jgi:hypothetical protein
MMTFSIVCLLPATTSLVRVLFALAPSYYHDDRLAVLLAFLADFFSFCYLAMVRSQLASHLLLYYTILYYIIIIIIIIIVIMK